ncbi:asparagine synthase (glutamine-hydrolyzing) [Acanthopleuribacter pedis]|uniref:asparagine synthase (glutamine-hydrolyzing) n=1 Tax=Acanthopleuribacter pedis TaxID=442870 RepID=A0A8J7Q872_9BACT|nr:asparagine synthase (glutamine-hydrolyzing) [Acanthopleuribacter pedis]MBO1317357.1 asparagine synthase (glutamine-hydrolyzing) [Acanthopleuribacter pedis]MBO1318664.1 asparagine synthase (glutamine-hydrolyzing) [Acanthopleuribacter pedis]
MCGIAGIFNLNSDRAVVQRELDLMQRAMVHRGPDGAGTFLPDPELGLVHVRLAIIDLVAASNQPFHFREAGLSLVFNGEIYNYLELREELLKQGYAFQTASDTEVLLKGYHAWGEAVVDRLNGMWAFAIWDAGNRRLFCSRDRFGIKPFNYAEVGGRFLFGSEIKSLLAVEPSLAEPNWNALSLIMRRSIGAQSPQTCFRQVHRLPPAHNLTVDGDGVKLRRYWDYPTHQNREISYEAACEEVNRLMKNAVRLRMRSDVPVGVALSSGLDSSVIACLAAQVHTNLETFTSVYEQGYRSEFPDARKLAESVGLRANGITMEGKNVIEVLSRCLHHLESPHASPAILPYWNITGAARRKVTVFLEGQGADELLAGYLDRLLFAHFRDLIGRGRFGQIGQDVRSLYQTAKKEQSIGSSGGPKTYFANFMRGMMPWAQPLYQRWRGDGGLYIGPWNRQPIFPDFQQPHPDYDQVNRDLRRQMEQNLVNLLHYGDAISMAHALESRLPFLDVHLVEFMFSLPGSFKFRDGLGKKILRDAMRPDVPEEVLFRRFKMGFTSPIAQWLREHSEDVVHPILFSPECRDLGIFDRARLEKMVGEHVRGEANYASQIFRWISMVLWHRQFIKGSLPVAACG